MEVTIGVPVLSNFEGLGNLIKSVDSDANIYVYNNWTNNSGVACAWNGMLRKFPDSDVLFIVNDDVTFHTGTIDKMVDYIYREQADLVSGVCSDTGQTGLHFDGFPDYCCYALNPSSFVEKFGYFDENFKLAYHEDNDMDRRIKLSGGLSALGLDCRIEHVGSVTQNMGGDGDKDPRVVSHHQFRLNRDYYTAKWGGGVGNEKYSTPFNSGRDLKHW